MEFKRDTCLHAFNIHIYIHIVKLFENEFNYIHSDEANRFA